MLAAVACSTADRSSSGESAGVATADSANVAAGAPGTPRGAGGAQRGEFVDGDERSQWMLTVMANGTTSIEDDARFGDDGQANRVFTFDASGTLVRATEQRTQTAQSGSQSPATVRTELIVNFSGSTPSASKMVDDVRRDVMPYEIDNLRRRANALLQQARRTSPR